MKTRFRSRLSEDTLQICIEGPEKLSEEELDMILDNWKQQKQCTNLYLCFFVIIRYVTIESLKKKVFFYYQPLFFKNLFLLKTIVF